LAKVQEKLKGDLWEIYQTKRSLVQEVF
jgi:hypothetical protein